MWTSALFIPATEPRFLAKAHERGAGAVVLDLEASVVPERKAEARAALAPAVETLSDTGLEILIRINMGWRTAFADLEAAALPGVSGILVPDVRETSILAAINGVLDEIASDRAQDLGRIGLFPIIESAAGVENARAIAACRRVVGLGFGVEDFLADQGGLPDPLLLDHAALRIAIAARAEGRMALVTPESLANLGDMERFRAAALRGRAMGVEAGFAAHPRQVAVLNACFAPSEAEIAQARQIVDKAAEAEAAGIGAFEFDGLMIDLPIVVRARRLLARAEGLNR